MEIASAYLTLLPSFKGGAKAIDSEISGDVTRAGKTSGSRFGKVFATSSIAPIRAIGAAAVGLFAVDKVKDFFASSFDEARESQKVGALTAQVIKTTGGAANVSAKQIGNLSTAISNKVGIDDEAIQSGANLLLTFTNIRNEVGKGNKIFDQATQIVTDMSSSLGVDMKSSAIQVGKALNDPIKGVSALQRVGVSFTQKQKDQIKSLVDSGKTLDAQKLILRELNKEFGGSAAAQATAGDKMKVVWGNFKEQIGTALLPTLDRVQTVIASKIVPAISTFITQVQDGTGAGGRFRDAVTAIVTAATPFVGQMVSLGTALAQNVVPMVSAVAGFMVRWQQVLIPLAAGIAAMVVAFKVWTAVTRAYIAVQTALNIVMSLNPIGVVILAVIGLAAALVVAYKRSATFRGIVNGAFASIRTAAAAVVGFFTNQVPAAFNRVVGAGSAVLGWVKGHWPLLLGILTGPIGIAVATIVKHWDRISATAKAVPGKIKGAFGDVKHLLLGIGGDIIQGLIDGIQGGVHRVVSAAQSVADAIPGPIKKILKIHSPSRIMQQIGEYTVIGLANGIRNASKTKLKAALDTARQVLDSVKGAAAGVRDSVVQAFGGDLFSATNARDFLGGLTSTNGTISKLQAAFKTLLGWGWRPDALSALFQSGNAALILDLAGSKSLATQAARQYQAVQSGLNTLGTQVSGAQYGQAIALDQRTINQLARAIGREAGHAVGSEINGAAGNGKKKHR